MKRKVVEKIEVRWVGNIPEKKNEEEEEESEELRRDLTESMH